MTAELCKWLCVIAKPLTEKAEFSRWVGARNADADQGPNWCFVCCEKEVVRLNVANPDAEYFVDGGWNQQSDSPPTCQGCGLALDDTLTEYGIEYELEHYAMHRIQLHGEYRAGEAFNFLKIIESAGDDPKQWGRNKCELKKLLRKLNAIHARAMAKEPK